MKLPSASNTVRSFKGILHQAEECSVGLIKKTFLSLCWLKNVKNETLLHVANPKDNMLRLFKKELRSQFLPRLKSVGFLATEGDIPMT